MNKIKSISVTQLFGYEGNDYKVELVEDEPLSFIYAFNGVGKSTLLKLMDAALSLKMTVLDSIKFKTLEITFDNGEVYTVEKVFPDKSLDDIDIPEIPKSSYTDEDGTTKEAPFIPIIFKWKTENEDLEGKVFFRPDFKDKIEDKKDRLNYYYNNGYVDQNIESSKYRQIQNKLGSIDTNLLFANKDYNRDVSDINHDKKIVETDEPLFDFSIYSKKDEFSFTKEEIIKFLSTKYDLSIPIYLNYLIEDEVNKLFSKLENTIVIPIPDKIEYIKEQFIKLAKRNQEYLELNKFLLGDEIILFDDKITLFEEIINSTNELTDKKLFINREELKKTSEEIDKNKIFIVKAKYGKKEYDIPINYLSSGEKNILLLYFHLIFELPSNTTSTPSRTFIDLIDEPEVSMHPEWLVKFVESLSKINTTLKRDKNYQFIISTHSPAISMGYENLLVPMMRNE